MKSKCVNKQLQLSLAMVGTRLDGGELEQGDQLRETSNPSKV